MYEDSLAAWNALTNKKLQTKADRAYVDYHNGSPRVSNVRNEDHISIAGQMISFIGIPPYIDDTALSTAPATNYGLDTAGWYGLLDFHAPDGVNIDAGFNVSGSERVTALSPSGNSVSVAVRFLTAAVSETITIRWDDTHTETWYITARDLATRNLDYRATYYVYDMNQYCTFSYAAATGNFVAGTHYYTRSGTDGNYVYTRSTEGTDWHAYALTEDATFVDGTAYFTLSGTTYTAATAGTTYTVGNAIPANTYYVQCPIPANTYYVHSNCVIDHFPQNVSYQIDRIDCPVTVVMPEVPGSNFGSWFELQFVMPTAKSFTFQVPTGVKFSGALMMTPTAGVNVLHVQYHTINHQWRAQNTNWPAQS